MNKAEALRDLRKACLMNSRFKRADGKSCLMVYEVIADLRDMGYYLTGDCHGNPVLQSISQGYHQIKGQKYVRTWRAWEAYFGAEPIIFILKNNQEAEL